MSAIPGPVEAAQLRAEFAGNPVIDRAEADLRAFRVEDPADVVKLLLMWVHYDELTERELSAVVARFVR